MFYVLDALTFFLMKETHKKGRGGSLTLGERPISVPESREPLFLPTFSPQDLGPLVPELLSQKQE